MSAEPKSFPEPFSRAELAERVTDRRLDELQQVYPRLDVRYVFRKLRDRYGAVPTLANLLKWLDTETDSRAQRQPLEEAPRMQELVRDPTCRQCDGTGFVKLMRSYNGQLVAGRAFQTYVDREGKTQRKLVRCDHQTIYSDPRHGEGAELRQEEREN